MLGLQLSIRETRKPDHLRGETLGKPKIKIDIFILFNIQLGEYPCNRTSGNTTMMS